MVCRRDGGLAGFSITQLADAALPEGLVVATHDKLDGRGGIGGVVIHAQMGGKPAGFAIQLDGQFALRVGADAMSIGPAGERQRVAGDGQELMDKSP